MSAGWPKLGFLVLCFLCTTGLRAQSPHGEQMRISCDQCHTPATWEVSRDSISFDHDSTQFALEGQHATIDCRSCHVTLVFSQASNECASCHTDMHQGSVGFDCARCHNASSWLVNNITELHEQVSFPLLGAHAVANCFECHVSDSELRFDRIGTDCINCHREEYLATSQPNHQAAGFSTECQECHTIHATEWGATGIDHSFFPLTLGHEINDCAQCHTTPDFSMTSPECIACHQPDFEATVNPDHQVADFSTDCASCHTTNPDWEPARFTDHDNLHFPIYSGSHEGVWAACNDCHLNPNNFAEFTCIACHAKPATDDDHVDVNGYSYSDPACLACHPTGEADGTFDHSATGFPLTGVHATTECLACHFAGYAGTPTECVACHDKDYQQTQNPDHESLGISTDCAMCHTTDPEWNPALFPVHNDYYVLLGAHAAIANECALCHNGDYNNTPNTCVGCHLSDYQSTNDPNHVTAQFSTDCATCHSQSSWEPATFDHDAQYFPIYSGEHEGEWSQCIDCHTNPNNYAEFTCITCHENPETNEEHDEVNGYVYNSTACLACHPTGEKDDIFDHGETGFALTGAHSTAECLSCHASGFAGTPNTCVACHITEFQQSANPNHSSIGIHQECATCHSTEPGWSPADFPEHDNYYVIAGAHLAIANDCAQCHQGNYVSTPAECVGCHQEEYDQTTDPSHAASLYPTDCIICHTQTAWEPSQFDHALTAFPLTGVHTTTDCASCHASGYTNTPTDCASCHTTDFNQTQNPNHVAIGLSTDCILCHTTDPGWDPASFPVHDQYYVLQGAHALIANDCATCHTGGDFTNTPSTCIGCHQDEYNQTTNPSHIAAQFSTDCMTCHNESAWVPATFDHDAQYFPIYSGAHLGVWSQCTECHTNLANYAEVTCTTCHANPETDNQHTGVSGYVFNSPACIACHPNGEGEGFDHNTTAFPLTGAHQLVDCFSCHAAGFEGTPTECAACHTPDFEQSTNPDHQALGLSTECASCHTTDPGWSPAQFPVHNDYYVIQGAHVSIAMECVLCHNGDYMNTPNTCMGCHLDDYNATTDPDHEASQFPTNCIVCHNENAWQPAEFDHALTEFPLTGAHVTVDCASCHASGYTGTPTECAACHTADYNQSANPNHIDLGLTTDCILCHTTDPDWEPAGFPVHNDYYALNGAHALIANDCVLCHNGDYNNTPNTCIGCHQSDFAGTTDPDHEGQGFPTDCILCHNENAWSPADFDHNNTDFPLTGAHVTVDCASCHAGGFEGTPTDCAACHIDDYNATNDPDHQQNGYPTDCLLCHNDEAWSPADFDHDNTDFPLTGSHLSVDCASCHTTGYSGTPTDCAACHIADYNASTNPDHQVLDLSTDCAQCHTTDPEWNPAEFPVHNQYYLLEGAHALIANDCALCHNGDYNNTPNTCVGCHLDDYNATNDPDHQAEGYPTDCLLCHSQSEWSPADFDHNNTDFPLTGAHLTVDCASCHSAGYTGTPTDCAACHQQDFNQSSNPDHQELGLSNDCAQCHTTDPGWDPADFPIHDQFYVLQGAHLDIANECVQCHNGNYNNTPNTCFGCHADDYNATNDPDHQAADFPTDCLACHNQDAWEPAEFDHDDMYFPIYSGAHEDEWNQCNDCHTNPNDYSVFTCLTCHGPGETNEDHDEVNNYEYNSNACLACHPNGEED